MKFIMLGVFIGLFLNTCLAHKESEISSVEIPTEIVKDVETIYQIPQTQ